MAGYEKWIIFFLILSFLTFLSAVILGILPGISYCPDENGRRNPRRHNKLFWVTVLLVVSVGLMRYSVGYFQIYAPQTETETEQFTQIESSVNPLTPWEEVFNSFVHTLQTFSMDEDYTKYLVEGKAMVAGMAEGNKWPVILYGLYTVFLNAITPIIGGAVIFEILASIFPIIKLQLLVRLCFWRPRYYFSELNEQTAAIVHNLAYEYRNRKNRWDFRKPFFIISDAYIDQESEKSSEMARTVKALGAICIKTDIVHLPKSNKRKNVYYLIDKNEISNLQTLSSLASKVHKKDLHNAKVYLFTENTAYSRIEELVMNVLEPDNAQPAFKMPKIIPVRSYRNLVSNLLADVPLYEPIVHKWNGSKDNSMELNVTILGNGIIGTEAFLGVYWCGQMLDCRLRINVVSQDSEDEFRQKIDSISPEILQATVEKHSILQHHTDIYAEPYCSVKYFQGDVKNSAFMLRKENSDLLDTHYFIVALGKDEDNMLVAEKLRQCIGRQHIQNDSDEKTVIAYVVYDSILCETLNSIKTFASKSMDNPDIYMHAFGSLRQVYSTENIDMTKYSGNAVMAEKAYDGLTSRTETVNDQNKQSSDNNTQQSEDKGKKKKPKSGHNDYTYWANMARVIHLNYKLFSIGWIRDTIFINESDPLKAESQKEERKKNMRKIREVFKCLALGRKVCDNQVTEEQLEVYKKTYMQNYNRLAWLEHRRWNAFTRVMGFVYTEDYNKYYNRTNSHKHMELKLHPCLVECDDKGIKRTTKDENGKLCFTADSKPDYLDQLTLRIINVKPKNGDFKENDYPKSEYAECYSVEQTAAELGIKPKKVRMLCENGDLIGFYSNEEPFEWCILKESVEEYKRNMQTT